MKPEDAVAITAGRLATAIGPRTMRRIARFHRYVTNPIVRRLAPRSRHMAIIEHTGRKSGRTYRTPVMAFIDNDAKDITIVLNYGVNSDWVRNVTSGTRTTVTHKRRRYTLTTPKVVRITDTQGLPAAVQRTRTPADSALQGRLTPPGPGKVVTCGVAPVSWTPA